MEVYDPYGLFEVDGKNIVFNYNFGFDEILEGKEGNIILKIEDDEKIIKIESFNNATLVTEQAYLNAEIKTEDNSKKTVGDLLKERNQNIDEGFGYNLPFGIFTIEELIKDFNMEAEYSNDYEKIVMKIPIYKLEADFISKKNYNQNKYLGLSEDDAILLHEVEMCEDLSKLILQQSINCKPISLTFDLNQRSSIPCIDIFYGERERILTPSFLRPEFGFKYLTPSFFKRGQNIMIPYELEMMSRIGMSFNSYLNYLKLNKEPFEKNVENGDDYFLDFKLPDIYISEPATAFRLEELFYKITKNKLTIQ